jgi:hypothetical protein
MATTRNGIATYNDVNAAYPGVLSRVSKQCPTFAELASMNFDISSQYRTYTNVQLVVFTDILSYQGGGGGGSSEPSEYYIEDALQAVVLVFSGGTCVQSYLILSDNPYYFEKIKGCQIVMQLMMSATAGPTAGWTVPTNQSGTTVQGSADPFGVPYANTAATCKVYRVLKNGAVDST